MGGFFGCVSTEDCSSDLYYGTDYHSHLGTKRGGMAVLNSHGFARSIHNIQNDYFRSKFEADLAKLKGNRGIGVISDYDPQPLIISSHLGTFSLVMVGKIKNLEDLTARAFGKNLHFSEMSGGEVSPTEMVGMLIAEAGSFAEGIEHAQQIIEGSCSMLILTEDRILAARDRLGRTPIVVGSKKGAYAAASESCSFPNLGYELERGLGPGEIVSLTPDGLEQIKSPEEKMQVCAFLWVYYGYPASTYEKINVEAARNRCGQVLARRDSVDIDFVSGIPDSGIGHAIGYAFEKKVPYLRPFVKYTPTWPRSFMPQVQSLRDLVAKMKLIPIKELIVDKRILFCEDSIVRGTQLQDTIEALYNYGAKEVHMRPACPTLIYPCEFLNFSVSQSTLDLAGCKAIEELECDQHTDLSEYAKAGSQKNLAMIDRIRDRLKLTTLQYQRLDDLVEAIGLPKERTCTHCWDGSSFF